MTDDEINVAWSRDIAGLATDALVDAGLLNKNDLDRATAIVAEEIFVRLQMKDRPDGTNWRFQSR
jgi:hypothetical protein